MMYAGRQTRRCYPWNSRRRRLCSVVWLMALIGFMLLSVLRLPARKCSFRVDEQADGSTAYFLLVNTSTMSSEMMFIDRLVNIRQQAPDAVWGQLSVAACGVDNVKTRRLLWHEWHSMSNERRDRLLSGVLPPRGGQTKEMMVTGTQLLNRRPPPTRAQRILLLAQHSSCVDGQSAGVGAQSATQSTVASPPATQSSLQLVVSDESDDDARQRQSMVIRVSEQSTSGADAQSAAHSTATKNDSSQQQPLDIDVVGQSTAAVQSADVSPPATQPSPQLTVSEPPDDDARQRQSTDIGITKHSTRSDSAARIDGSFLPQPSDIDVHCSVAEIATMHFSEEASSSSDVEPDEAEECTSTSGDRLYVLYYKDVSGAARHVVRDRLTSLNRTCANRGCPLTLTEVDVPDGSRDALTLNDVMMDAYLDDEFSNFYVIVSADVVGSAFLAIRNLRQLVLRMKFEADANGITAEFSATSATKIHPTTMPVAVLFTRTHFEIFGVFFPRSLPDLRSALTTVVNVYRTFNLTAELKLTGSDVVKRDPWTRDVNWSALVQSLELYVVQCETLRRYLDAISQSPCFRCPVHSLPGLSRVISMSLYGTSRRYTMGAIRNAQLAPIIYPGWRLRFYTDPVRGAVPGSIVARLLQLGAEIRHVNRTATGLTPMMWRFTVVDDPDVDVFIVRDCDSRLTSRDAAVVDDWLRRRPEALFHCIRDHPSHSRFSISGGLWGGRRAGLAAIFNNSFCNGMRKYSDGYMEDMNFLGREVWPHVQSVTFCHDSVSCNKYPSSHPFPVKRIGPEHLGQVFDQYSVGRQDDIRVLNSAKVVSECNPQ